MNDLIIEGAKGIPDGLYVKKDGELFKYKPNRGTVYTVRSYHITDRPRGEWVMHGDPPWYVRECSQCGTKWHQWSGVSNPNYCSNCGADMRGEDE